MKSRFLLSMFLLAGIATYAQQNPKRNQSKETITSTQVTVKEEPKSIASERNIKVESSVITNHSVNIDGKSVPYKATTGTLPVWDEDGKPIAGLFYTYYERSDVSNRDGRP